MTRKFLVTGATGRQGGATAKALLDAGHQVRALTRNPGSPAATRLAGDGVEIVKGDFDDRDSLLAAMRGVEGAFLVTNFIGDGASVESEERQGKAFVDAARSAELQHLVFTSVGSAERNTGIPHFESKWRVERHARAAGLAMSVVRPVFFMENLHFPWLARAFLIGALRTVLGDDKRLQIVAARDIGRVAASMLSDGPTTAGRTVELAGDALTAGELVSTYRAVAGKNLASIPVPRWLLTKMPEEIGSMLLWFGADGYRANIPALRAEYPFLLTFEGWLREGNRL